MPALSFLLMGNADMVVLFCAIPDSNICTRFIHFPVWMWDASVCLAHKPFFLFSFLTGLWPSSSEWHTNSLHSKQVPAPWPLYSSEICRQQDHLIQGRSSHAADVKRSSYRCKFSVIWLSRVQAFPTLPEDLTVKFSMLLFLFLCSTPYGTLSLRICLSSSEE